MNKIILLGILLLTCSGASAEETWSQRAVADLTAAHNLIRDNHPGPVDPQNPKFRIWLEQGFVKAMPLAQKARTRADYDRALNFYMNGFRDGHLHIYARKNSAKIWPGFLTATAANGTVQVVVADPDSPVATGATLVSCDGTRTGPLLDEKVNRYYSNADIPHEAILNSALLFTADADDTQLIRHCRFLDKNGEHSVDLKWHSIGDKKLHLYLHQARHSVNVQLGLHQVNDVWFVSMPTFNLWGKNAGKMQAFVDNLKKRATDLHKAPYVVIDVRGNGGGNSSWGLKVAEALWGQKMVRAVINNFDGTTDWRTSKLNARLTREAAKRSEKAGLMEDAADRRKIADSLDSARARGESLYRLPEPPSGPGLSANAVSPFSGKVYYLTDMSCASACLDFSDIMLRLPGVTHVGLPTSADAVYIDNVAKMLPSGIAKLSWSVKVYRHRVRGNNQWYEPAIRWPGGVMTDNAVAAWIKKLSKDAGNGKR